MHLDNRFIRSYKKWLLQFNNLKDCSYRTPDYGRDKFTDFQLAFLRNNPSVASIERDRDFGKSINLYRKYFIPNYQEFTHHLVHQRESTIYMINSGGFDTILMLADLDNKQGTGQPQQAAKYFSQEYLGDRAYIEPSTFGNGCHVYFKLDVSFCPRKLVHEVFTEFAERFVLKDKKFADEHGITFDRVWYGLPTIWTGPQGAEVIAIRGNELKIPYVSGCQDDLATLEALPTLCFKKLAAFVEKRATSSISLPSTTSTQDDMGVTSSGRSITERWDTDAPCGKKRRTACVSYHMIKSNGACTTEEILEDYHEHYHPTGMAPQDIRKRIRHFNWQLSRFRETFRPASAGENPDSHPFKRDEYLGIVTMLVGPEEFAWTRREVLNHRKLADFISIKMQDAFYSKQEGHWFAAASRDATIANMRTMKEKGLVDWIVNGHIYSRFLEIAVKHNLLEIYEDFIPPTTQVVGRMIKRKKGRARVIGPGAALPLEHARFLNIYETMRSRSRQIAC